MPEIISPFVPPLRIDQYLSYLETPEEIEHYLTEKVPNLPNMRDLIVSCTPRTQQILTLAASWSNFRELILEDFPENWQDELDIDALPVFEHIISCQFTGWRGSELPPLWQKMPNLQHICVANTHNLRALPESLAQIPKLRALTVNSCSRLKYCPTDWANTQLDTVHFQGLPRDFEGLHRIPNAEKLAGLMLSDLELSELPAVLWESAPLQSIVLQNCVFKKLPLEVFWCKHLHKHGLALRDVGLGEILERQAQEVYDKIHQNGLGDDPEKILWECEWRMARPEWLAKRDFNELAQLIEWGKELPMNWLRAPHAEQMMAELHRRYAQQPDRQLKVGDFLSVMVKCVIPKTVITKRLKKIGLAHSFAISPKTTHVVLGIANKITSKLLADYTVLTEAQLIEFLNTHDIPPLLDPNHPPTPEHLAQLKKELQHEDLRVVELAIKTLETDGLPVPLIVDLLLVTMKHALSQKAALYKRIRNIFTCYAPELLPIFDSGEWTWLLHAECEVRCNWPIPAGSKLDLLEFFGYWIEHRHTGLLSLTRLWAAGACSAPILAEAFRLFLKFHPDKRAVFASPEEIAPLRSLPELQDPQILALLDNVAYSDYR